MRKFGYVCEEDLERQEEAFKEMGKLIPDDGAVFSDPPGTEWEKRSGFRKMLRAMEGGGEAYFMSPAALGTTLDGICTAMRRLECETGASARFISCPALNGGPGTEASVLAALEFSSSFIRRKNRERQKKAYRKAKENGKRYGRPRRELPDGFGRVAREWLNGNISGVDAAAKLDMPLSSFRYRARKMQEEEL